MRSNIKIAIVIIAVILIGLAGCKSRKPIPPAAEPIVKEKLVLVAVNTPQDKPTCQDCLAGLLMPLKDFKAFEDTKYSEVLNIERNKWNKDKLPPKVSELEGKGYFCYPVPSQSTEKAVRWECQLWYQDFRHLAAPELDKKAALEKDGYVCERRNCIEQGRDFYVWVCCK